MLQQIRHKGWTNNRKCQKIRRDTDTSDNKDIDQYIKRKKDKMDYLVSDNFNTTSNGEII